MSTRWERFAQRHFHFVGHIRQLQLHHRRRGQMGTGFHGRIGNRIPVLGGQLQERSLFLHLGQHHRGAQTAARQRDRMAHGFQRIREPSTATNILVIALPPCRSIDHLSPL
jgi:hypothetical protein